MERLIERSLFASRWMMAPMYVGLAGALIILLWVFLNELLRFGLSMPSMTVDDAVLGILALIDLSLAANLLLIVIFSGYENFVSRMDLTEHKDRPEWQGEVDFSGLKLKLVASIVAISGIHLLKVFMDVGKYPAEKDPLDGDHPSGLRDFGRAAGADGLDRQSRQVDEKRQIRPRLRCDRAGAKAPAPQEGRPAPRRFARPTDPVRLRRGSDRS